MLLIPAEASMDWRTSLLSVSPVGQADHADYKWAGIGVMGSAISTNGQMGTGVVDSDSVM